MIYEAFHVKITNIAEAQFPHLLHKTYTHIVYNMFPKTPRRIKNHRILMKFQHQSKSFIPKPAILCAHFVKCINWEGILIRIQVHQIILKVRLPRDIQYSDVWVHELMYFGHYVFRIRKRMF